MKYHQLSAENLEAKFALFPLFSGNPILEEVQITHFKLSEQALNHTNIHGRFTDFHLKIFLTKTLRLKVKVRLVFLLINRFMAQTQNINLHSAREILT